MARLRCCVVSVARPGLIGVLLVGIAVGGVVAGLIIDLASQPPDLLITGDVSPESLGVDLVLGDLDGDGMDDLVIGSPWADRAADARFAGHVYVFFGGEGRPPAVDDSQADVVIIGAEAGDMLSGNFERQPGAMAVGDVNGDRLADLVLGAPESQNAAGQVYILLGRSRADWRSASPIDLGNASNTVTIRGLDANDAFGGAVAIGDVNGDSMGDLLVSAPRADGNGNDRTNAGEVFVFFGRSSWPAMSTAADASFRLIGTRSRDALGIGLVSGQIGGSDVADLVIGSSGGAGGEVHVVLGTPDLNGEQDLSTSPADTVVLAADDVDRLGRYLAVGDVSGDGQPDLVIGVPGGDGPANNRTDVGEVAVLFGPLPTNQSLNLADEASFVLYGPQGSSPQASADRLGDNVALGDFNADGVWDIFAGARQGDGVNNERSNAGEAYVVFGGSLPRSLDLTNGEADIIVYGQTGGDFLGRVAAGNFDGWSPDDLVLGAHWAQDEAGKVFVIYRRSGEPMPTLTTAVPTVSPQVTVTPSATVVSTPTILPPSAQFFFPLILNQHAGKREP